MSNDANSDVTTEIIELQPAATQPVPETEQATAAPAHEAPTDEVKVEALNDEAAKVDENADDACEKQPEETAEDIAAKAKAAMDDEIKTIRDLEKRQDQTGGEIGRHLLEIEEKGLYKFDKDINGKPIKSMTAFIKKNFTFTSQYGSRVAQTARVQQVLGVDNDVSFNLLKHLNPFVEKPDDMNAIWKDASTVKNKSGKQTETKIPTVKELRNAIQRWRRKHGQNDESDAKRAAELELAKEKAVKAVNDVLKKIGKKEKDGFKGEIDALFDEASAETEEATDDPEGERREDENELEE